MEKRDRHDIIRDILTLAIKSRDGVKITEIMNHVQLSTGQAKQYIEKLLEAGLIERKSKRAYHTTQKGALYLAHVIDMAEMFEIKSAIGKVGDPLHARH